MGSRRLDMRTGRGAGFSLLELVLVVILLGIFAGALAPAVAQRHAEARDVRRLADLQVLVGAIEQYKLENGRYPAPKISPYHGEWEVSHRGGFLPELVAEGFLRDNVFDPLNDEEHHYAYTVYAADSHGCEGGPFYVIGIRGLETEKHTQYRKGYFSCSGRDWNREFAYVTGGGARAGTR